MLMDLNGALAAEHSRELRRAAAAYRAGRHGQALAGVRAFIARGYLGPVDNYRAR